MSPNKSQVGTHRLLLGSTFNEDRGELASQLGNERWAKPPSSFSPGHPGTSHDHFLMCSGCMVLHGQLCNQSQLLSCGTRSCHLSLRLESSLISPLNPGPLPHGRIYRGKCDFIKARGPPWQNRKPNKIYVAFLSRMKLSIFRRVLYIGAAGSCLHFHGCLIIWLKKCQKAVSSQTIQQLFPSNEGPVA